jgi:hypothetical protein
VRHHDDCFHAEQPRGQRDGLPMVARRERDDATRALIGVELRDRVVCAAELERADALLVLALEVQRRAALRIGGARRVDRRAVRNAGQARVRGGDVVVGDRKGWGSCRAR